MRCRLWYGCRVREGRWLGGGDAVGKGGGGVTAPAALGSMSWITLRIDYSDL